MNLDRLSEALGESLLPIVRIAGEDARGRLAERLAHYGCPAVGVAVLEDGSPRWSQVFGARARDDAEPAPPDTVFAGASISKPLTAALVMQQVERGRLDLDADVNRYLSAWQVPHTAFTRERPVTLRHLLSHRAGTTVHGFGGVPPSAPRASVLDTLLGRPPATTGPVTVDKLPGGTTRYSGGGYTVVQLVLEELTGRPFAELARRDIFEPLGMALSSFEDPLPSALANRVAAGHDGQGRMLPERIQMCAQAAAGGVFTTAQDFARFIGACRDAYIGRHTPLMRPQTARAMVDARGDGEFGLGWRVVGQGAAMRIAHGGSNDGYQCETTCYLDSGRGAVVLTNAVSGALLYLEVLNTIAEQCDWPGFLRAPKQVVPMDAATRQKLAGRYRIVQGVESPYLDVSDRDGLLWSYIEGMRAPPLPVMMDTAGRLFNRFSLFESSVRYGADGRAAEIVAYDGTTEVLRAVRADGT